jgi:predicted nucleotidyltransferase
MSATRLKDPVLLKLRRRLEELYGDRLARVVFYGSRARGDWNAESDYDVAVFLKDMPDWGRELDRLADLRVELFDQTGETLDAKPYLESEWPQHTALMGEIRRDSIDI